MQQVKPAASPAVNGKWFRVWPSAVGVRGNNRKQLAI
jgi:hypothetical protein